MRATGPTLAVLLVLCPHAAADTLRAAGVPGTAPALRVWREPDR